MTTPQKGTSISATHVTIGRVCTYNNDGARSLLIEIRTSPTSEPHMFWITANEPIRFEFYENPASTMEVVPANPID